MASSSTPAAAAAATAAAACLPATHLSAKYMYSRAGEPYTVQSVAARSASTGVPASADEGCMMGASARPVLGCCSVLAAGSIQDSCVAARARPCAREGTSNVILHESYPLPPTARRARRPSPTCGLRPVGQANPQLQPRQRLCGARLVVVGDAEADAVHVGLAAKGREGAAPAGCRPQHAGRWMDAGTANGVSTTLGRPQR